MTALSTKTKPGSLTNAFATSAAFVARFDDRRYLIMGGKPWTDEDKQLLRELAKGDAPMPDMMQKLGRSESAIRTKMSQLRLTNEQTRSSRISKAQRRVHAQRTPAEAREYCRRLTRKVRIGWPEKYEQMRQTLIRVHHYRAAEADKLVREAAKKDGVKL